jgi:hypothetical protein
LISNPIIVRASRPSHPCSATSSCIRRFWHKGSENPRSNACHGRCNAPRDQRRASGLRLYSAGVAVSNCVSPKVSQSQKRRFDRLEAPDGAPVASCRYENDLRVVQLPRASITETIHPTRVNSAVCIAGNSARMELSRWRLGDALEVWTCDKAQQENAMQHRHRVV